MRRRSWIALITVVAIATAATLFFWPHDVTAVIHNQGPAAMLEVRVDVTGGVVLRGRHLRR